MSNLRLVDPWPAVPKTVRLLDCRLMLLIHGALTDAEAARVLKRIQALAKKEMTKTEEEIK